MTFAVCVTKRACIFLISLLLISCASKGTAPVVYQQSGESTGRKSETVVPGTATTPVEQEVRKQNSQGFHIVRKGDTLYSIAWNYGFDYREVAGWNTIQKPYLIYPGQVLRLKPAPLSKASVLHPGPVVEKTHTPVTRESVPNTTGTDTVTPAHKTQTVSQKTTGQSVSVIWRWPVKGKIIKSGSPTSKKGVDISGRLGQDIKAAAQGDVVYSGSGLLGYGRLIIIKHNETFLSAYAYNSELLVKEGESVGTGQRIAKMGKSSAGRALLHFEIRKNGKSVNPLKLLPKS